MSSWTINACHLKTKKFYSYTIGLGDRYLSILLRDLTISSLINGDGDMEMEIYHLLLRYATFVSGWLKNYKFNFSISRYIDFLLASQMWSLWFVNAYGVQISVQATGKLPFQPYLLASSSLMDSYLPFSLLI